MADVVQFVETFWTIRDQQALIAAKRMQKQFHMVSAMANRTAGAIGRMASAVASPIGLSLGTAGITALVKHLVDVGQASEDSTLSLTALLQQASGQSNLGFAEFERASAAALQLRDRFRDLAVDSPATANAIKSSFESTTFFLSQAGLSLEQQATMARDLAVLDKQMGGQGTVGRDVAQLLAGRGGAGDIQTPLLKAFAKEAAKLAKSGKMQEAAALIQKQIQPDPALLKAYGNSFGGLTASMGDQLLMLKEEASKPLLEYISGQLKEWIGWLKDNKKEAKAFAREIGQGVARGLKAVVDLVKFMAKHWDTIVTTVKTLATVWIAGSLAGALLNVIGLAKSFGKAMAAAKVSGSLGGIGRKAGLIAGGAALISEGEALGEGFAAALNFISGGKGVREVETWTEAQRDAWIQEQKLSRKLLNESNEATKNAKGKGGGGRMKVRELIVDKMSARDRDFARLSTPATRRVDRDGYARRPLAGMGLAVSTVGS